ncbi:MAG TPA: DNA replication/repair protein RecF [Clostridia bacterium]|nr:DNA replication/repair protein RecF [Clostridia bacterium]
MRIQSLKLHAFRNYESAEFRPDPGITVLCGQNAQGKTNLLEAIHLCCLGRSHRTVHDREMIRWEQPQARVRIETQRRDGTHDVVIALSRQDPRGKLVRVGGSPVSRIGELMGHVTCVLFSPEDLRLVKEGPGERRRFLDMALSQLRPAYFYALQRYVRTLSQRNGLLKTLAAQPNGTLRASLNAWDDLLVSAAAELMEHRVRFLERLSIAAQSAHGCLSGDRERLTLRYVSTFAQADAPRAALAETLKACRETDERMRTTTVGPHREDIELHLDGKPLRLYGSQGQQRTAALSLKLAVLSVMREEMQEAPVLLLDDVMSELDPSRRRRLLGLMADVQTVVTCTDAGDLGGADYGALYRIESGSLMREGEP